MEHVKVKAAKIVNNIWVGDGHAAMDAAFIKTYDIRAVLNLTPNVPFAFAAPSSVEREIEYLRIPVYDIWSLRDTDLFLTYLPCITEFIYKNAVIENKQVLVHCIKGRQRSGAAVAAYLIKFYGMEPKDAVNFLLKRKVDVFHWGESVNFADSLNKWNRAVKSATQR